MDLILMSKIHTMTMDCRKQVFSAGYILVQDDVAAGVSFKLPLLNVFRKGALITGDLLCYFEMTGRTCA